MRDRRKGEKGLRIKEKSKPRAVREGGGLMWGMGKPGVSIEMSQKFNLNENKKDE